MAKNSLILVRGLPGSGKNTFAEMVATMLPVEDWTYPVFSADDYFMEMDSALRKLIYKFDGAKIKLAHENCRKRTEEVMKMNVAKIFVANTFTQDWEMAAYYDLAKKYNYKIFSVIVENRHHGINIHGVPEEALERMEDRFSIKL